MKRATAARVPHADRRGVAPAAVPRLRMIDGAREVGQTRLASLDAFRGLTIAGMILVNNPGSWADVYAPLRHAEWNGWTAADLVFPFFLFIAGTAVPLALAERPRAGRGALAARVARRALLLFVLGIILNGFPRFEWETLRIPGTLQRIAICYACAATAVLLGSRRAQWIVTVALLLLSWLMLSLTPFPSGPAALDDFHVGSVAAIDAALLPGHLLHGAWDPEGLGSTIPAIATTMLGVLAGYWLRDAGSGAATAIGLAVAGIAAVAGGEITSRWIPVNKSLWTPSYVLLTGGLALDALAACIWFIDLTGWRRSALPFVVYGRNPIVAYVFSTLSTKVLLLAHAPSPPGGTLQQYIFQTCFVPLGSARLASLLYALTNVIVWLLVARVLYRRRVVITI